MGVILPALVQRQSVIRLTLRYSAALVGVRTSVIRIVTCSVTMVTYCNIMGMSLSSSSLVLGSVKARNINRKSSESSPLSTS